MLRTWDGEGLLDNGEIETDQAFLFILSCTISLDSSSLLLLRHALCRSVGLKTQAHEPHFLAEVYFVGTPAEHRLFVLAETDFNYHPAFIRRVKR
jgi:hypothetical protein